MDFQFKLKEFLPITSTDSWYSGTFGSHKHQPGIWVTIGVSFLVLDPEQHCAVLRKSNEVKELNARRPMVGYSASSLEEFSAPFFRSDLWKGKFACVVRLISTILWDSTVWILLAWCWRLKQTQNSEEQKKGISADLFRGLVNWISFKQNPFYHPFLECFKSRWGEFSRMYLARCIGNIWKKNRFI